MSLWNTAHNGVKLQDFLEFNNYFLHRTKTRRDVAAATEHTGASTYTYTAEEASKRSNFDEITQAAETQNSLEINQYKLRVGKAQHRFGWQASQMLVDKAIIDKWNECTDEVKKAWRAHEERYEHDIAYQAGWNKKVSDIFDKFKNASGEILKGEKWH